MTSSFDPIPNIERLIRPELLGLKPYEPIEPLEVLSQRCGVPVDKIIKLDGNENPYGCSPRVQRALADYSYYHIYTDPLQRDVRQALERYVGVGSEHIVMGSGSDELIDLTLRLLLEPGDKVINCQPTFGMYSFSTAVCGGQIVDVPRDSAYAVDVAAVKKAVDPRTKAIFIASPNNPTGNVTLRDDILELVRTGIMVVVDEAYCEFSGQTVAPLVLDHENLIVLRTFSKWAGLGGLRIGYGIFPVNIADLIFKIKPPYNVNIAAQVAALASLADLEYLQGVVRKIVAERERLYSELKRLGFLEPLPSQANFILCRVLDGPSQREGSRQIVNELAKVGIFVRYYDTPLLRNFLRISVGKPEHTDALVGALRRIGGSQ